MGYLAQDSETHTYKVVGVTGRAVVQMQAMCILQELTQQLELTIFT